MLKSKQSWLVVAFAAFSANLAVAGVVVQKAYVLENELAEYKTIDIQSPGSPKIAGILHNSSNETKVEMIVTSDLDSDHRHVAEAFIGNTSRSSHDGELQIRVGGGSYAYQCSSRSINGDRTVTGVCMDLIVITLPVGSHTRVMVNGTPVADSTSGPMSVDELRRGLSQKTFDSDKLPLIKIYIDSNINAGAARFVTISEVMTLMGSLAFDDAKVSVAQMFSGRVIDPANAYRVMSVLTFDRQKGEAAQALSR
jgi:hypothetical protein